MAGMKVSVQQRDGEIRLALNGDPMRSWPVANGVVEVDDADAQWFLDSVEGSQAKEEAPQPAASGVAKDGTRPPN